MANYIMRGVCSLYMRVSIWPMKMPKEGLFSMTISLLKFCMYDILRPQNLKKAQICSNSGTKLVKFHGGSQNSMTFCSFFMFLEFSTFIFLMSSKRHKFVQIQGQNR